MRKEIIKCTQTESLPFPTHSVQLSAHTKKKNTQEQSLMTKFLELSDFHSIKFREFFLSAETD